MRAIVRYRYGSTANLQLCEIERPAIADDEVLVRVRAAGVDRGAWHLMTGLPYLGRLAFGVRAPKNPVLGTELAGVVEAVGSAVTTFEPGDEVFGIGKGTFADHAAARESKLAPKPAGLSFEQAAALPISGSTALQAVRDHAEVQPGDRVLVIGASGGVGSYAVQLAKHSGATVTGVCSTTKIEFVRSLGADHVIDYTQGGLFDGASPYDVILDIGGNTPLAQLRRGLTAKGRLVIVGGEGGGRWFGGIDRQLRATMLSPLLSQKLGTFINREHAQDLSALAELAERGHIAPALERSYMLEEAPEALRHLEQGRTHGKVVVASGRTP